MPEISRFLGIIIKMYFKDHNPPHFHVTYNEYEAIIDIKTLGVVEGSLPPKVHSLVIKWADFHKEELLKNWEKTQNLQNPDSIDPLT